MQRYMEHFPAAGEIVIFDRSWYNRAGVEHVMGFSRRSAYKRFLELCPEIERYIVEAGILLIKVWLEVGQEEQQRRFRARIKDPLRQWKLSPMDVGSFKLWYDYSKARDVMLRQRTANTRPGNHSDRRQAQGSPQLHRTHPQPYSLQDNQGGESEVAGAIGSRSLR